jgi:hypothetical protein
MTSKANGHVAYAEICLINMAWEVPATAQLAPEGTTTAVTAYPAPTPAAQDAFLEMAAETGQFLLGGDPEVLFTEEVFGDAVEEAASRAMGTAAQAIFEAATRIKRSADLKAENLGLEAATAAAGREAALAIMVYGELQLRLGLAGK